MDRSDILRRFDRELREDPPPADGVLFERDGAVVREISDETTIVFHRFGEADARGRVDQELARARARGQPIEWKVYAHDLPPSMPRWLAAAGFAPDLPETLVVRDLVDHPAAPVTDPALEVTLASETAGGDDALRVRRSAFGDEDDTAADRFRSLLTDPAVRTFVVRRDGRAVSSGRVDLPAGRTFASLWGGGTVPDARHRGAYRALVEARAACAAEAGFRYLLVEARETSRPTLERVGFVPLDAVQGWRAEARA